MIEKDNRTFMFDSNGEVRVIEMDTRPEIEVEEKNKLVACLLAIFLGCLGIHKFYLGRIFQGVLHIVFSLLGLFLIIQIISIIEGIIYITSSQRSFNATYSDKNYKSYERRKASPGVKIAIYTCVAAIVLGGGLFLSQCMRNFEPRDYNRKNEARAKNKIVERNYTEIKETSLKPVEKYSVVDSSKGYEYMKNKTTGEQIREIFYREDETEEVESNPLIDLEEETNPTPEEYKPTPEEKYYELLDKVISIKVKSNPKGKPLNLDYTLYLVCKKIGIKYLQKESIRYYPNIKRVKLGRVIYKNMTAREVLKMLSIQSSFVYFFKEEGLYFHRKLKKSEENDIFYNNSFINKYSVSDDYVEKIGMVENNWRK